MRVSSFMGLTGYGNYVTTTLLCCFLGAVLTQSIIRKSVTEAIVYCGSTMNDRQRFIDIDIALNLRFKSKFSR